MTRTNKRTNTKMARTHQWHLLGGTIVVAVFCLLTLLAPIEFGAHAEAAVKFKDSGNSGEPNAAAADARIFVVKRDDADNEYDASLPEAEEEEEVVSF